MKNEYFNLGTVKYVLTNTDGCFFELVIGGSYRTARKQFKQSYSGKGFVITVVNPSKGTREEHKTTL